MTIKYVVTLAALTLVGCTQVSRIGESGSPRAATQIMIAAIDRALREDASDSKTAVEVSADDPADLDDLVKGLTLRGWRVVARASGSTKTAGTCRYSASNVKIAGTKATVWVHSRSSDSAAVYEVTLRRHGKRWCASKLELVLVT